LENVAPPNSVDSINATQVRKRHFIVAVRRLGLMAADVGRETGARSEIEAAMFELHVESL